MLVLSRRLGEQLVIGKPGDVLTKPVNITVLGISGNQVRIGINAQGSVSVHRLEIQIRIDEENAAAAAVASHSNS